MTTLAPGFGEKHRDRSRAAEVGSVWRNRDQGCKGSHNCLVHDTDHLGQRWVVERAEEDGSSGTRRNDNWPYLRYYEGLEDKSNQINDSITQV